MTTNELKSYVNRILGNNIRLLLPSYWWKKAFGAVIDNTVSPDSIKTINGESVIGEGDLRVGVKNVESVEALETLDAVVGDIATVAGELDPIKIADCYYASSIDIIADVWDKLTIIKAVEEKGTPSSDGGFIYLQNTVDGIYSGNFLVVGWDDKEHAYGRYVNGTGSLIGNSEFNHLLKLSDYRFSIGNNWRDIDSYFSFYTSLSSADAYIKADSWDKLAKEHIVASESDLARLDVPNGTIAKVAKGDKTVGSFNDLAVGDRVTDVEFMQPPYASGGCSVMFKDKDGNGIGFGVYSNGKECLFGLDSSSVGTILFGNENGIDPELYDQAMASFKERECTFEYVDGTLPVDSFVRPVEYAPVVSDAYIKADTWKRLLKEGDVTGGGGFQYAVERTVYPTSIIGSPMTITEEQRAYNAETARMQNESKDVLLIYNGTPLVYLKATEEGVSYGALIVLDKKTLAQGVINIYSNGDAEFNWISIPISASVDSELSTTSQNPVQNKVITSALNDKADKSYVDEKVANISSEEGLEYRKLYAKGDAFGIVTGELTAEQKAYNIETINLYKQNKAIIGYEQVIGGISRITLCKGTDSNGEATNFYFAHVLNASVLISIAISADGSGTYQSDNGLLIDSELSETSTNPVQNKVVTTALVTLEEGYALNAQQIGVLKTTKADKTYVDEKIANKQDTISDLATIRSNATLGSTAIQKVKTINGESITGDGNVELFTKALYDELVENMLENEEVYAAAVNDLNTRVENNRQHSETTYATKAELLGEITDMTNSIVENEEVIAATLNDLLARIDALVTRVEQLENA